MRRFRIPGRCVLSAKTSGRGQADQTAQPAAPTKFAANGVFSDNLAQAQTEKDRGFIDSITSGKFHNQSAAGVETALSAMLGRMAGRWVGMLHGKN